MSTFLKFALNPSDETAFRRMVRLLHGVGEKTADSLSSVVKSGAESAAPFGEVLRMFPGSRSLEKPDSLEEERRLFYVAITRGRDHLHLCYPLVRLNSGYGDPFQRRSRFLAEIPTHLLEKPGADEAPRASTPAAPKKSAQRDWWY